MRYTNRGVKIGAGFTAGVVFSAVMFLAFFAGTAAGASKQQILVDEATISLKNFMADRNMDWFQENLHKAKGLLIVPGLLKGGFIFGGSGGRGVFLVQDRETGEWHGPAFYTMGSVSWGLQIGGQKAEVMIMVWTQDGKENLYSSNVKLGGDTSVALGPVGMGASGAVAAVTADYLSFARAKGAYAGLSVEGSVIDVNEGWNEAYYGKPVRPVEILVQRTVRSPKAAELRAELKKAAQGK